MSGVAALRAQPGLASHNVTRYGRQNVTWRSSGTNHSVFSRRLSHQGRAIPSGLQSAKIPSSIVVRNNLATNPATAGDAHHTVEGQRTAPGVAAQALHKRGIQQH